MQLSRRADYGIRLLLELSMLPEGSRTSTEEIAVKQRIPVTFLSKIARQLAQAGLVRAYPGLGGGLELGRDPHQLTMLDAIQALEGPIAIARCTLHPHECPRSAFCPMHQVWKKMEAQMVDELSHITFDQLAQAETRAIAG
ncbi:MAG: Rrf2 family transcriptional regulator [Anaerolineae bacterium]|jgi:Rrf2 family protein|nr:Rrf2 family transcriptional regulator [Anaerolineae bacterium]